MIEPARTPEEEREFYSLFKPGNLFILHQRERAVLKSLRRAGVDHESIGALRVLEVGCGWGGLLPSLITYGANPAHLTGLDLDSARVTGARARFPVIGFVRGDASVLPIRTAAYDVVIQSTLFTSLLHQPVRRHAAAEMCRVLRPGGFILWFDFRYDNPRNPRVRGVTRAEIEQDLFPGARASFLRTVLLPPLARRLVPVSRLLAEGLSLIPPLLTHYCALIWPGRDNRPPP